MWQCKKCKEYAFKTECKCFELNIVDEEGESHSIFALDPESAALQYAKKSNSENDYYLMDSSVDILVDGKKFRISAEPDVNYAVDEIR